MAANRMAYLLGVLLLIGSSIAAQAAGKSEFLAPEPKEVVKAEGGRVQVWEESFKQIQDADLGAAIITVEPRSLALPEYSDSPTLFFVLEGRARVGLVSSIGINANVRHIKSGDVWAIPRGWVRWIWNEDDKQPLRLVGVAETSQGPQHGAYTPFHIIGGKEEYSGGIIHGFSKEILAHAWDVEESDVEELLKGQDESGFVKVGDQEPPHFVRTEPASSFLGDFVYSVDHSSPDVCVEKGGTLRQLNAMKLPVLKKLGLGLARVQLKRGALVAPQYLTNAPRLIYITSGKGRIEVAYPDGRSALRSDVKKGDVVIVPTGFPSVERADENEELHYVSFAGSHLPIPAFLAGGNSLYKAIPRRVRIAGFGVDEDLAKKFDQRRLREYAIFPPRQQQGRLGGRRAGGAGSSGSWAAEQAEEQLVGSVQKFMEDARRIVDAEMELRVD